MYSENSRFRNFEDRVPQRRPSTRQTFSSISRSAAKPIISQNIDVGALHHEIAQVHHVTIGPLPESTDDHRKTARYSAVESALAGGLPAAELHHVRDTNIPITTTMQIIRIE